MKIAVKEVGKPLKVLDVDFKYRSECVKYFIGKENLSEFFSIFPNGFFTIGVDEEGLLKGLPLNFYVKSYSIYFPVQIIVGTAVFTRIKPPNYIGEIWDYELDNLTDGDLSYIENHLYPENQIVLREVFKYLFPDDDSYYTIFVNSLD